MSDKSEAIRGRAQWYRMIEAGGGGRLSAEVAGSDAEVLEIIADEIERLEAKVKAMEWARDQAVQAWEVNTEENDRLRAALEEIRDGATTYDPADYGWQRTGGSLADCQWCDHWSERGVVKHYEHCPARIAREALNDD